MKKAAVKISITKDLPFILNDGLCKIREHGSFLILLWGLFYIPTNFFTYFRLEPYLNQSNLNSFRGDILFMIILLNILGYIPMITIALLIRESGDEGEHKEYNSLVMDAFKRIPFYISTTLALMVKLLLPLMAVMIPLLIAAAAFLSTGSGEGILSFLMIPLFLIVFTYFFMRYFSSTMFYLMKDLKNFRAVRFSVYLFQSNKKMMIQMMGLCYILPLILNYSAVFFIEDTLIYLIVSLLVAAYMYFANGIFANMFLYLEEDRDQFSH